MSQRTPNDSLSHEAEVPCEKVQETWEDDGGPAFSPLDHAEAEAEFELSNLRLEFTEG